MCRCRGSGSSVRSRILADSRKRVMAKTLSISDVKKGSSPPFRRFLAAISAVVFGTTIALAVAEGIARIVRFAPVVGPSFQLPVPSGDVGALKELVLGDMIRPNVRGLVKGSLYTTNNAGFRGPDVTPSPTPGVFRIMIAGDSVVMGEGVLDEETYARLLERELNDTHPDRRFEVLNIGLSGLTFSHVLNRVETLAHRFRPHLVVYGWTINDIEGPAYRASGTLASFQARYDRFDSSPSFLLRALWPRWVSIEDTIAPSQGSYAYDLRYNYFENDAAWRVFPDGFARLAKLGATSGLCVHVFLHTQLFGLRFAHPFKPIYERVEHAAVEHGLSVTSSFPVFAGRNEWMLTLAPDDPHPNAAGHRLLAQALAGGLRGVPEMCQGG